jgi:acyl carrier protein
MKDKKLNIATSLKNIIINAWKKELNLSDVKLDEDFFDLGGHSLKLINILDTFHKNQEFPIFNKLNLLDLFEYTTVRTLTDYLLKIIEV